MAQATPNPILHRAGAPALNDWLTANNVSNATGNNHGGNTGSNTNSTSNSHFKADLAKHKAIYDVKPWLKDPHYVRRCYISAVAILKMLMHGQTGKQTRGGGANNNNNPAAPGAGEWLEVMGQMQGHVQDNAVVLTDSFGVPVPATAVECGLDDNATAFMVKYEGLTEASGKPSKIFGWYHTHPGYTAFLSGTDVNTQRLQQMVGGPVVALVLDPVRTLANGKIELKAFRTYPENFNMSPADSQIRKEIDLACQQQQMLGEADPSAGLIPDGVSAVNAKTREVAHFAQSYYEVPITIFRSEKDAEMLEQLWGRFWSKTFSASPHVENRDFLNKEIGAVATHLSNGQFALPSAYAAFNQQGGGGGNKKKVTKASDATGGSNAITASLVSDDDAATKRSSVFGAANKGRGAGKQGRDRHGQGTDAKFDELLPLSRNMGIDAMQCLLTAHVKQTIFGGGN